MVVYRMASIRWLTALFYEGPFMVRLGNQNITANVIKPTVSEGAI